MTTKLEDTEAERDLYQMKAKDYAQWAYRLEAEVEDLKIKEIISARQVLDLREECNDLAYKYNVIAEEEELRFAATQGAIYKKRPTKQDVHLLW